MTGAKLKRPSRASDALADELRRKIVTMELSPGVVVTEAELCQLLGCTRSPLREALQRLASEHLVTAVPRRGVTIAELRFLDFSQLVEAMDGMYAQVGRLAAVRITDDQLRALDEIVAAEREHDALHDHGSASELDWRFHHEIAEAADNRFLCETMDTLGHLLMRFTFLGFRRAGSSAGAVDDHAHIVEALRAHDPDAVQKAMTDHMAHGRERMLAGL